MIRELKVPQTNITYSSKHSIYIILQLEIFVSLMAESRSVACLTLILPQFLILNNCMNKQAGYNNAIYITCECLSKINFFFFRCKISFIIYHFSFFFFHYLILSSLRDYRFSGLIQFIY